MLQQVEGSGPDPYADCRNAIAIIEAVEAHQGVSITQNIRERNIPISEAILRMQQCSRETLKNRPGTDDAAYRASINEFGTESFRRWLMGKLGMM